MSVARVRGWGVAVALSLTFALQIEARGDDAPAVKKPPAQQAIDDAREHYRIAMSRFELGEWAGAIEEFKAAYEISHAPGLLFNLAQAYRKKKDYELSLHSYQAFLRLAPEAPNRADVEAFIAEMEKSFAEQQAEEAATAKLEADAKAAEAAATVAAAATAAVRAAAEEKELDAASARAADELQRLRRRRTLRIAGVSLAAAGIVIIAAGVYSGVREGADSSQATTLSQQGAQWDANFQALYADGQRSAGAATVLDIAGGAVFVAGAVVGVLGLISRGSEHRSSSAAQDGSTARLAELAR